MNIVVNNITVCLADDIAPFTAALDCTQVAEGLFDVILTLKANAPAQLPEIKLSWSLPSVDFHHKWNSECMQNRALDVGNFTANYVTSRANRQAPVYSLYNLDGINTCTFALSDAVHDTRLGGTYASGLTYTCSATINGAKIDPVMAYSATLRFDFRRIPYYQSLRDIVQWWQAMPEYRPCQVPDDARKPLFSSWYVYEMDVDADDLEKQCQLAKACGMDVAILDDGWQTEQVGTGYRSNGDWEVHPAKFADFAAHVKRIQDMGLKYLVWFSVPFVGVDSKAYKTMKHYLMPGKEGAQWFGFDPRFPQAREYLASIYERFVRDYGIDGLKMDFIGSIGGRPEDETGLKPGHDTVSIGAAVCKLLDDVMARLHRLNPDILIEFRQGYIGPAMRKYGNMFRAVDCPNSIGDNRVRTLDVRLLSGDTAVHSDPITWHDDDPPESAAMQLIHALFSAPQISRRLSELTPAHLQMLKSYLRFWRQYRGVLMEGELAPLYPHLLYPLVAARNKEVMVAAFYANMPLECNGDLPSEVVLVNGTYKPEVLIDTREDIGAFEATTVDCLGNTLEQSTIVLAKGIQKVPVTIAGHTVLKRGL
ncbi:MAG: alpha-galactosidase [Lentisphaeria bacterium]|nr:alpha-galactosidase [Lentisphaeria bacterium]